MFAYQRFIVACALSGVLALFDIVSKFDVPRGYYLRLMREPGCYLYVAFYMLVTLGISGVLNEQEVVKIHPWSWSLGLGLGIPLALQMKIKFDTPWLQGNTGFNVGLQQVADRVRYFCDKNITDSLNASRLKSPCQ